MEIVKTRDQKRAVEKAVAILKDGGLVIYPTETCYGLGADATNTEAVKKLLEFKGSRGGKAVSVAVSDRKMAERYVEINETARNLYQKFLPGPLTVVSKSKARTDPVLQAGKETLGIRIPDYPLALKIIRRFGKPITSTSANTSGKKTPYCLKDVLKYTTQKRLALIDLFLDAGQLLYNSPSTVVDTTLNEPRILRQGEIKIKASSRNTFISESEEKTQEIAQKISKEHEKMLKSKCLVFALQGELGSGKTQFAKGLAKALGIRDNVVSPTFTIIREYPFKQRIFYHLDTWRLEKGEELLDLGLEKMLKPGNVVAIEWVQKMRSVLVRLAKNKKIQLIWVNIKHLSETKRKISYQN
ncbi:MAG: threonylcarbamoyl-AMP synthase [Candidatus Nealsonbacteria bacterium]|nr:threonylcarbamoyl-AMP synthase [Candidatus Nealsonbacteria bacterium]